MNLTDTEKEIKLLWNLVESSYDGLFMTDADGKVLYCNQSYLRISGLSWERIVGQNIAELVKSGEIPDACSADVIRTRQPQTKVIDYFHGVRALVTSTPVFDEFGVFIRVLSNVRNITELVRIKEQLMTTKSLNEEYRRRLWQAEQASREDNKLLVASPQMEKLAKLCARIANISSAVLIQGESGVGKDMLARYIHDCSNAPASRPFVQINCSAIPETLLESELFGYESGAFTGASRKGKIGLFELAHKGTLFLDEIGEMPMSLQVKLLDVLQSNKMYRVGGVKPIEIKARIIAATNTNLNKQMAEGRFRSDLYYRLNVIPVIIPPLRERREDLLALLFHFIERNNQKFHLTKKFTPRIIDILASYSWPGNVRELRNAIENMMVMTEDDLIDEKHIPSHITKATGNRLFIEMPDYFDSFSLKEIIATVEREVIRKALTQFGSLRAVAYHLCIDLSTLVRKKRKYQL
jgi:PAS domain S-box-containing protein